MAKPKPMRKLTKAERRDPRKIQNGKVVTDAADILAASSMISDAAGDKDTARSLRATAHELRRGPN